MNTLLGSQLVSDKIKEHYGNLFKQHGRDHVSVQYSTRESQLKRFEVLLDVSDSMTSISDMGCGLADILPLVRKRFGDIAYHGYDFVDGFIESAKEEYKADTNASFHSFDVNRDTTKATTDYVVLSGMLNNKMENNAAFTKKTLDVMWQACDRGLAFNALSTYVDYQDSNLYYQDPLSLFDYCKRNLSPYVKLRHDYDVKSNSIPFEFTIYVYKKGF